jgi:hypothetical protein
VVALHVLRDSTGLDYYETMPRPPNGTQKPIVFISHIHEEESCANALEQVLRRALLGALDIFNSSNRTSITTGDPWRDRMVESLKRAASVLVIASPKRCRQPLGKLRDWRCVDFRDTRGAVLH